MRGSKTRSEQTEAGRTSELLLHAVSSLKAGQEKRLKLLPPLPPPRVSAGPGRRVSNTEQAPACPCHRWVMPFSSLGLSLPLSES